MKLCIFETEGGEPAAGAVEGDAVTRLGGPEAMPGLLAADPAEREARLERARAGSAPTALAEVRLRAPLAPPTLRDFLTFERHVEGMAMSERPPAPVRPGWYEAPTFYFSNSGAIFGDGDEIAVPPGCGLFDFELEVAAVIGRPGRDLDPAGARDHIAGYTIYDDFSARDAGAREAALGLGWAKAKDFANVLGPWIVTADELEPYRREERLQLRCTAFRNGEEIGSDSLASMAWSFEEMIAYASRGVELRTGDVLGSGTCGSGCLAELWGRNGALEPRPLQPGDEVRLEVEAIGSLTNRVVPAAVAPVPVPAARV